MSLLLVVRPLTERTNDLLGFGRTKIDDLVKALIGATGALDRAAAELLRRIDSTVTQDPFRLAFYSMSAVSFAFFMYSKEQPDRKAEILDAYASRLISALPKHHAARLDPQLHSPAQLMQQYRNSHRTYSDLLGEVFVEKRGESATTMMMVLWQDVTGQDAKGKMIRLSAYSAMLLEFTQEAFRMVKERV